jgi:beta-lactamase regulating signal transducer with metallopeptidase domain
MNDVFYSNKTPLEISSQGTVQPMAGTSENIINSSILPNVRENATNTVLFHSAINNFRDLFNQYALYLWLLGIIVALTVNLTGYARFSKYLKRANKPATDEENRILASLLNGRNNVRLVRNRFSTTPMLIGILRPYIIIPDINFNEKQLKNILLHEIAHLKHFDIGVKWLTMIAASIHWFNPLVYFIKKEINHACELACDEAVIKDLNPTEKQAYCDTLISAVSENKYPMGILQATMSEEKETLKERLVAIMKYNKKSKPIILMSIVLLIAVISGAVLLGACSGKTNQDVINEKEAIVSIVEGFGSKLQTVSLLDPKNVVEKSMQENYGNLVSQALIEEWISGISDPLSAPGRLTSSPWPDRIEILSIKKLSEDRYEVKGEIIEITSVEKVSGGVAAKRPVTLALKKIKNRWLIDDVTLGAYEETGSIVH